MPERQSPNNKIVVAIINTSVELIEALEMAFQQAGFDTVWTTVPELKQGKTTLETIFSDKRPAVIVYDVALPYKENWDYLQNVRADSSVGDARFILTTTNKRALEDIIQTDSHTFEILGLIDKPFNLDDLLIAVKAAAKEVEEERSLQGEKQK